MRIRARTARRVVVWPYRLADWKKWREGYGGRDPHAVDEDPSPRALTADAFRALTARNRRGMTRDVYYGLGIFHRRSGDCLGGIDLVVIARLDMQLGHIGYFLHSQHWRQGLATEAVPLAFAIAFEDLHLHRLEASIRPENERSIRLAERVGMRRECIRRNWSWDDDHWADHVVYVRDGTQAPPRIKTRLRDVLR